MLQIFRRRIISQFKGASSHLTPTPNPSPSSNNHFRRYSTHGKREDDRWWIIGTMTVVIPAAFWVYNQHENDEKHSEALKNPAMILPSIDGIIVKDLKDLIFDSKPSNNNPGRVNEMETGIKVEPLIRAEYLLIGGGAASFSAMEEIKRLDPEADIFIISDEQHPPYTRPPLSKELWFNKDHTKTQGLKFIDWHGEEKPIFFQSPNYFETQRLSYSNKDKARLLLGHKAIGLDPESKTVTLDDGRVIGYGKVLIATGGKPKMLPQFSHVEGEVTSKVSTFRSISDFQDLQSILKEGKHIAIIGGGFLGSEVSVALAQYSKSNLNGGLIISQLFPEDGNMSLVFPRYLSKWTMSRVRRAGVQVMPKTQIQSVERRGDKLQLSLDNGNVIDVDHALVAIGIEPNIQLAVQAGLEIDDERGGIVTNSELQVRKDIYAAGDVISFYDTNFGSRRRVEHFDNAILSGKVAGYNMVNPEGKLQSYINQSMFWSDLGPEVGYEAVGIVDSKLTTVGVWAEATLEDSPRGADLDPTDIRSQQIGSITSRNPEPSHSPYPQNSIIPSPSTEKTYGKGVVFYIKDRRIVGLLMFNLFNRLALARDIINRHKTVEELQNLVELFNINEQPITKLQQNNPELEGSSTTQ